MRFGIEAGSWNNPRGYGRFLRGLYTELVRRGRNDWVLVVDRATAEAPDLPAGASRIVVDVGRPPAAGASAHRNRTLTEMFRMSRALSRARFDALLFPSPLTYVPVPGAREVLVLHDVIAERHPELVFESSAAARRWRWKTKTAVRRARRLVTISERSRSGIAEVYGINPARIAVAPESADPIFFESPDPVQRPRPYVLFVGGLSPHKNIRVLLEALREVPDIDLVLAGPFGTDRFHVEDPAPDQQSAGLLGRVERMSGLDDVRLRDLYAGALALVLPSFEEGFGLPAVEAAASGTAVVLSRAVGAAEFLDGALLFDPRDARELASHLRTLYREPQRRMELARKLRRSAGFLSWRKTAELVERVVEDAASE